MDALVPAASCVALAVCLAGRLVACAPAIAAAQPLDTVGGCSNVSMLTASYASCSQPTSAHPIHIGCSIDSLGSSPLVGAQ